MPPPKTHPEDINKREQRINNKPPALSFRHNLASSHKIFPSGELAHIIRVWNSVRMRKPEEKVMVSFEPRLNIAMIGKGRLMISIMGQA
jgi:hypothetical protein